MRFTSSSRVVYKLLPPTKNIFKRASFFFSCFFLHFHRTPFSWACGSLREPRKIFSFSTFTCLSNNSLISWWILAKLGSALPPCMLYLSYCFQPTENTWMCLWKVITLQVDFFHNLDPRQIICISFEIVSVYWCITL